MYRVGLEPIAITKDGLALDKDDKPTLQTGQRVTDRVIAGGPFEKACAELLESGFELLYEERSIPKKSKDEGDGEGDAGPKKIEGEIHLPEVRTERLGEAWHQVHLRRMRGAACVGTR